MSGVGIGRWAASGFCFCVGGVVQKNIPEVIGHQTPRSVSVRRIHSPAGSRSRAGSCTNRSVARVQRHCVGRDRRHGSPPGQRRCVSAGVAIKSPAGWYSVRGVVGLS